VGACADAGLVALVGIVLGAPMAGSVSTAATVTVNFGHR